MILKTLFLGAREYLFLPKFLDLFQDVLFQEGSSNGRKDLLYDRLVHFHLQETDFPLGFRNLFLVDQLQATNELQQEEPSVELGGQELRVFTRLHPEHLVDFDFDQIQQLVFSDVYGVLDQAFLQAKEIELSNFVLNDLRVLQIVSFLQALQQALFCREVLHREEIEHAVDHPVR